MLTTAEHRAYRAHRADGMTPVRAHRVIVCDRIAADVLTLTSDHGWDGTTHLAAYGVDSDALHRVTSSPVLDAYAGTVHAADGTRILSPIVVPADVTLTVAVVFDEDSRPDDGSECYSPDDVTAWRDDRWNYVGVIVTAEHADGRTGDASLWGIESGAYWPGSDAADIWHAVPDLIRDALREVA